MPKTKKFQLRHELLLTQLDPGIQGHQFGAPIAQQVHQKMAKCWSGPIVSKGQVPAGSRVMLSPNLNVSPFARSFWQPNKYQQLPELQIAIWWWQSCFLFYLDFSGVFFLNTKLRRNFKGRLEHKLEGLNILQEVMGIWIDIKL